VPDELWRVDRAARRLRGVEESLRRLAIASDVDSSDALESLRAGLVWLRGVLLKAARDLDADDPRRPLLAEVEAGLMRAGQWLAKRDLSACADCVAAGARVLDSMLTPAVTLDASDLSAQVGDETP
jgi:hypothetical protein